VVSLVHVGIKQAPPLAEQFGLESHQAGKISIQLANFNQQKMERNQRHEWWFGLFDLDKVGVSPAKSGCDLELGLFNHLQYIGGAVLYHVARDTTRIPRPLVTYLFTWPVLWLGLAKGEGANN
jgi:hypothetical protein